MTRCKKIISFMLAVTVFFCCFSPFASYAATENQLRSKVVSIAENEVGYKGSSTYSKYGDWYGYQGGWCTTFAFWCFNKAGSEYSVKLYGSIIPSGGNCNSMISWFSSKGRYKTRNSGYKPKAGDLVFFDWSGNGSSQHVGIVSSVSGSTIYTVEGNCSGYVKARTYTKSGSKPYNNISAIMGYGVPDFASAATGKSQTTNSTTKKSTANSDTKPDDNIGNNTLSTEKRKDTISETSLETNSQTETETTTDTTTEKIDVEKLSISASTYDLQVGDTVKLNYSTEPENAPAVIGYFCDQEGIIEINSGGDIKAVGEGTATVVVCANDELYSQCDFTVTKAVAAVTTTESPTRNVVGKVQQSTTERNLKNILFDRGIDLSMLSGNKGVLVVPGVILGGTAIICIFVGVVKKIKGRKSRNF